MADISETNNTGTVSPPTASTGGGGGGGGGNGGSSGGGFSVNALGGDGGQPVAPARTASGGTQPPTDDRYGNLVQHRKRCSTVIPEVRYSEVNTV